MSDPLSTLDRLLDSGLASRMPGTRDAARAELAALRAQAARVAELEAAVVKYAHAEQRAYEDAALIADRKRCKYVAEEIRMMAADKWAENKFTN